MLYCFLSSLHVRTGKTLRTPTTEMSNYQYIIIMRCNFELALGPSLMSESLRGALYYISHTFNTVFLWKFLKMLFERKK